MKMRARTAGMQDGFNFDMLNWPVAVCSLSILPWLKDLWDHAPGLTGVYTSVTTLFMLFQMADKLGLLERFKRKPKPRHPRVNAEK